MCVHAPSSTSWTVNVYFVQASTADSARSVQSTDSGSEHQSKTTSKTSRFSHSVFMPTSARSTSTVETDDGFNLNVNLSSYAAPLRQTPEYNGNHYKDVKTSNSDYKPPSRIKSTWMDTEDPASLRESALSNKNNPDSPGESPQVGSALPRSRSDSCNMNCDDPDDILTRTYSVPVCNNEMLNSHADVMSQKAMKLNSIANNMTSQAFSGGTKAPLHSMQNSYQNIKPKTPVNEVRQSPSCSPQVGRNIAEDYIKKCNMAATKIQRWYRRHQPRLKACEAAMRRLLHTKRQEKEDQRKGEKDLSKLKEEDRKKAREERARQARQQAIEVRTILYITSWPLISGLDSKRGRSLIRRDVIHLLESPKFQTNLKYYSLILFDKSWKRGRLQVRSYH